MSFDRRSVFWAIVLCASLTDPGLWADTVYLKNGAWIDGMVRARDEQIVEVQIGEVGKIEIKVEEIYEIEKNNRTGAERVPAGMENSAALAHLTREGKKKQALEQAEESKGSTPGTAGGREPDSLGATEDENPISPELEARIKQLVADLQRHNARFRTRAERQLKAIGAPAVRYLLPAAKTESDLARIAVFRILNDIGDDRAVDTCIDGLLDPNEYVRDLANKTLHRVTREDFGYQPQASPRRRENSHSKWVKWWTEEKARRAEELEAARQSESSDT